MLDALYRYAVDPENRLVPEPGFTPKSVKWAIYLDGAGDLQGVSKVERTFASCPELNINNTAHPLLSEVGVVTLFTSKEEEEPTDKLVNKHHFFRDRLREAAAFSPGFRAASAALSDPKTLPRIRGELREQKAKATDKVTFFVGDTFPIEATDWHDWWRTRRVQLINELTAKKPAVDDMVCLITGEVGQPLRVHPKITGLASGGKEQSEKSLVSFDKSAFCSYGLEQSANAAISEDAATAYRAALNDLLKKSQRLAGMKVAHWFSETIPSEYDALRFLTDDFVPDPATKTDALNEAKKLLIRLKKGGDLSKFALYRYYALSLSGAGGRVMVRDWMTGSFEDLARAVEQWFEDFSIVPLGQPVPPTLEQVITCGLPTKLPAQEYEKWIKPVGSLRIPLWRAALNPKFAIPNAAATRALQAFRLSVLSGDMENLSVTPIRVGLMKAALIRQYRSRGDSMEKEITPELNAKPSMPVAYHCGRLVALLAALQGKALGNVNAGVVQRYYGRASVTPNAVIGRLIQLSNHHLEKIRSRRMQEWYRDQIADIMSSIPSVPSNVLNPTDQTLFALGYYHQIPFCEPPTKQANDEDDQPTSADSL